MTEASVAKPAELLAQLDIALRLSLAHDRLPGEQIDAAINIFHTLAREYIENNIPSDIALQVAQTAAINLVTHSKRVDQLSHNHKAHTTPGLNRADPDKDVRTNGCSQIVYQVIRSLHLMSKVEDHDIRKALGDNPQYETAAIAAWQYLSQEFVDAH